jgi:hypothetical protein
MKKLPELNLPMSAIQHGALIRAMAYTHYGQCNAVPLSVETFYYWRKDSDSWIPYEYGLGAEGLEEYREDRTVYVSKEDEKVYDLRITYLMDLPVGVSRAYPTLISVTEREIKGFELYLYSELLVQDHVIDNMGWRV